MTTLAGKGARVTGGSPGIGRGVVARLAEGGAALAFSYVANEARAWGGPGGQARAWGRGAGPPQADSGDVAPIAKLVTRVAERFGKIDILVSNAGVEYFGAIEYTGPEDCDRVFAVNTRGQFFLVQQALPFMPLGGGIVSSSSVRVDTPLARHAVAPGPVLTDMAREPTREYQRDYPGWAMEDVVKAKVAAARLGTPKDIAHVIAYLVSDQASWITGPTLHVDGGTH